jgi:serine/threonine protein kinase
MGILLLSSAVPTSLQDVGKAISPRDSGTFDYDDSTGALSLSSAAPMSPQDSDFDSGDLVDEVEVEGYTEELVRYVVGLHYPIRIGDVLNGTYRIVHKLGYGESSTVWLARDIFGERDVALKIMIPGKEGEDEYSMQMEILSTVQDISHLVTCLTAFSLPGRSDKGNHRVLVFPVRGPNFNDTFSRAINPNELLEQCSMTTRMSAARQLLCVTYTTPGLYTTVS